MNAGSGRGRQVARGGVSPVWQVLMVCTGNICRSPMAERLARRALAEHGRPALAMTVTSAGTLGWDGSPMHPDAATALAELGGDPTGFHARSLTTAMVERSDLVLCATRAHRTQVVTLLPRTVRRCFTFTEFARLTAHVLPTDLLALSAPGDAPPPPPPAPPAPPALSALSAREVGRRLVEAAYRQRGSGMFDAHAPDNDVDDPLGRGLDAFQECAVRIGASVTRPFELLARADRGGGDRCLGVGPGPESVPGRESVPGGEAVAATVEVGRPSS